MKACTVVPVKVGSEGEDEILLDVIIAEELDKACVLLELETEGVLETTGVEAGVDGVGAGEFVLDKQEHPLDTRDDGYWET